MGPIGRSLPFFGGAFLQIRNKVQKFSLSSGMTKLELEIEKLSLEEQQELLLGIQGRISHGGNGSEEERILSLLNKRKADLAEGKDRLLTREEFWEEVQRNRNV